MDLVEEAPLGADVVDERHRRSAEYGCARAQDWVSVLLKRRLGLVMPRTGRTGRSLSKQPQGLDEPRVDDVHALDDALVRELAVGRQGVVEYLLKAALDVVVERVGGKEVGEVVRELARRDERSLAGRGGCLSVAGLRTSTAAPQWGSSSR